MPLSVARWMAALAMVVIWPTTAIAIPLYARQTSQPCASCHVGGTTPNPLTDRVTLKGYNPYWRLAATAQLPQGQSLTVGAFGLDARQFPDYTQTSGPTDRFRDVGIDLQYQFLGGADWQATAHAYRIREHANWNASAASHDAPTSRMTSTRLSAQLVWRNTIQASLGTWRTAGATDFAGLGTTSGRGDTAGRLFELAWMPTQNIRVGLQRTQYTRFAGLSSNYDGAGRNASSNNTTYLYAWVVY